MRSDHPAPQRLGGKHVRELPRVVRDLFLLQLDGLDRRSKQVSEVEVLVQRLALRVVRGDWVHVDVERYAAVGLDLVGADAGLFGQFAQGRVEQGTVALLDVSPGQQPLTQGAVFDGEYATVGSEQGGTGGHVPPELLA